MLDDAAYYSRREAAERELAQGAAERRVREVHLLLADKYAQLAQRALAELPGKPGDRVPSIASKSAHVPAGAARKLR